MIEINGKIYRNLQEQVKKNMEDIEDIQTKDFTQDEAISDIQELLPYKQDKLTAGEGITIENNVISSAGTTYTAGNGIDITDDTISIDDTKVVVKDSDGNVDGILQVAHLQSENWEEDDDNKADIYLSSGLRRGRVTLSAGGEESSASIMLQGTTSVGSGGYIEISGETNFITNSRITVTDSNNDTEEVAYLSDLESLIERITALENNN